MELYKEEKVNPMWSCGFLIVQLPILIVIYHVILTIKDPSNSYYLYSALSEDIIEKMNFDFFGLDLLWIWWLAWLLLAISVAVVQFIQIKLSLLTKKNNNNVVLEKKKDEKWYNSFMPPQDLMNKYMLYGMPIMVWIFTYNFLAWVWIYWIISTGFMIFQQLVVNKVTKINSWKNKTNKTSEKKSLWKK